MFEHSNAPGKEIRKDGIALPGTTYKGDVNNSSPSPSEPMIWDLMGRDAEVTTYYPHRIESFGAKKVKLLN
nr:hypothetical protein [Candidatus Njordarchaeota archaeon]